jgi:hypothetical protein
VRGSEGKCSEVQHREGVKVGCKGKGIYGCKSGEKRRIGGECVCVQYGEKNIRNYIYSTLFIGVVFLMCMLVNYLSCMYCCHLMCICSTVCVLLFLL